MLKLYIDIGSSTVKVYLGSEKGLDLIETKSFHFKDNFDPKVGITEKNKAALIKYVIHITKANANTPVKVYATGIFRKLDNNAHRLLGDDFFRKTGLYFNVISHDLEGHYLETALSAEYGLAAPLLLINIGGGSTELVVIEKNQVKYRYNLELGVGTVLTEFPFLNEELSKHSLDEVVNSVKWKLPTIDYKVPNAIYNGGELTYMKLAGYKLTKNSLFTDQDHPSHITTKEFASKNNDIFRKVGLRQLENLMPNDPLWMHGARACSAIAQATAEHFGVQKIIPSDSNTVHGVVKQEMRSVVLSGSFRKHLDYILGIKRQLTNRQIQVLSPRFEEPKNAGEEFVVFEGEQGLSPLELERYHLDMIEQCDALVICASGGYVGASALIEIGYAQALNKRIIFTEKPEEFMLQTLPAEIGL